MFPYFNLMLIPSVKVVHVFCMKEIEIVGPLKTWQVYCLSKYLSTPEINTERASHKSNILHACFILNFWHFQICLLGLEELFYVSPISLMSKLIAKIALNQANLAYSQSIEKDNCWIFALKLWPINGQSEPRWQFIK